VIEFSSSLMSSPDVKIIVSYLGSRKPFRLTLTDSFELDFLPQVRDRFAVPPQAKLALLYGDPDTGEDISVGCQGDWRELVMEANRCIGQGKVLEGKLKLEQEIPSSSQVPAPPIRAPPSVNSSGTSVSASVASTPGRPSARASVNFGASRPVNRSSQSSRGSLLSPSSAFVNSTDRPRMLSYVDSDESFAAPHHHRSSIGSFSLSDVSSLSKHNFASVDTVKWSTLVRQFNEAVEQQNPNAAIEAGKELLKMDSKNVDVLYNVGVAYSTIGKYSEAIETWNLCVKVKPDHSIAYLGRGGAHSSMGNLNAAVIDFTRSATLEPFNALAHHSLAVALAQSAKHSEAADSERSAITILERDPSISIISGVEISECWYNLGKFVIVCSTSLIVQYNIHLSSISFILLFLLFRLEFISFNSISRCISSIE
jgi:hypothetical protein